MIDKELEILRDLVAFKSVTPDDAGSLDYIADFVEKLGGKSTRVDRNQTTNLISEIGTGNKIFAFAGHVDVVPTGDVSLWKSGNPFEVHQDGETLIGRGVADMKGSIAAFMVALAEFVKSASFDDYKIMLLITSDEEGDATDGTPLIVEYLKENNIRIDNCVIGEPSCTDKLGDVIKVGRRGSLTGNLTILGKQGHIAYPHLCENPIHTFAPALAEISQIKWDSGNQYFPPTSLQFANINSGLGVSNVIPGKLTCNFNFRYNTEHTHNDLQQVIVKILDKHNLKYELTWSHSAKPFMAKVGSLVGNLHQAINNVCGITPENKTDGGTSDGRFLIDCCDEMLEFGLRNNNIHQINESIQVQELTDLTKVYLNLLQLVFKK